MVGKFRDLAALDLVVPLRSAPVDLDACLLVEGNSIFQNAFNRPRVVAAASLITRTEKYKKKLFWPSQHFSSVCTNMACQKRRTRICEYYMQELSHATYYRHTQDTFGRICPGRTQCASITCADPVDPYAEFEGVTDVDVSDDGLSAVEDNR